VARRRAARLVRQVDLERDAKLGLALDPLDERLQRRPCAELIQRGRPQLGDQRTQALDSARQLVDASCCCSATGRSL
jgi:hypothetical protein